MSMKFSSPLKTRPRYRFMNERSTVSTGIPTLLYLPEILSIIFSFLSQHTLKHSARFVCKRWFAVSRALVRNGIVWKYYPSVISNPLDHLHEVTDFSIVFFRSIGFHYVLAPWDLLYEKLLALSTANHLRISTLELSGTNYLAQLIYPLLPMLSNLSCIRMTSMEKGTIHLGVIIQLCPMLQSLYIESPIGVNNLEDMDDTRLQKPTSEYRESKIKTLVLECIGAEQATLEIIIKRCPFLRELRLIKITPQESSHRIQFSRTKFYETVARSCQYLECFHFSITGQPITLEHAEAFHRIFFPDNKELELPGQQLLDHDNKTFRISNLNSVCVQDFDVNQDTTPYIFAPILDPLLSHKVTTLEIIETGSLLFSHNSKNILHAILCSTPSLLHLIAPSIGYYAEWVDFRGISARNESRVSSPIAGLWPTHIDRQRPQRRIWACRRLRTLEIKFISKDYMERQSAEGSRIMFDYISRVCPVLRELVIYREHLNLELEGGFCFLLRLYRLERLSIMTKTLTALERKDLEWMSSQLTPNLNSRIRLMPRFESRQHIGPSRCPLMAMVTTEELCLEDFDDVGSIENLELWRRQITQGIGGHYYGCWPSLEFLKLRIGLIRKGKYVQVEDYLPAIISEIRPGIEFQCETA